MKYIITYRKYRRYRIGMNPLTESVGELRLEVESDTELTDEEAKKIVRKEARKDGKDWEISFVFVRKL